MKVIKLSFEDTTTIANAKTITSATHSEPNISSSGPLVTYELKTSSHLEGSMLGKIEAASLSIISGTKNETDLQLVAPKQKAFPLFCLYSFLTLF